MITFNGAIKDVAFKKRTDYYMEKNSTDINESIVMWLLNLKLRKDLLYKQKTPRTLTRDEMCYEGLICLSIKNTPSSKTREMFLFQPEYLNEICLNYLNIAKPIGIVDNAPISLADLIVECGVPEFFDYIGQGLNRTHYLNMYATYSEKSRVWNNKFALKLFNSWFPKAELQDKKDWLVITCGAERLETKVNYVIEYMLNNGVEPTQDYKELNKNLYINKNSPTRTLDPNRYIKISDIHPYINQYWITKTISEKVNSKGLFGKILNG